MLDYVSSTGRVYNAWPKASPFISAQFILTNRNLPLPINIRRPSPLISVYFCPRGFPLRALSPGLPPPPPDSDPKDSGSASTTRLQESTRIFFAVLFWMTLFFWSAIWDGRDNDGGTSTRPRKGSWFRR